jgi:hypothetical protein
MLYTRLPRKRHNSVRRPRTILPGTPLPMMGHFNTSSRSVAEPVVAAHA